MKKIDLGQPLAIVANLGVIAGIAFLAYEMRQNTVAITGSTLNALSEQSRQLADVGLATPELRLAYARVGRGLEFMTPEDAHVLGWWYASIMRVAENRYRQSTIRSVYSDIVGQLGGASDVYRHPYFGFYWKLNRHQFAEDFAEWADKEMLPSVEESLTLLPQELWLPEVRDALPRDGL